MVERRSALWRRDTNFMDFILKEGGLTPAAKLIRAISHVYDAEMRWYTHENMFIMFWKHLSLPKQLLS